MIAIIKYGVIFIMLVFLQIFVVDELHINFLISPMLYIAFIFMLPFNTPKYTILILGFLLGFCIDGFENTLGMHAAASTAAAFTRIFVQNSLMPRDGYENLSPTISSMGIIWYIKYIIPILLVNNIVYFILDFFNFSSPFYLIAKILISSIISFVILFYANWSFGRHKAR